MKFAKGKYYNTTTSRLNLNDYIWGEIVLQN